MEYVNLGKSGLRVSRLCLGCMTYGEAQSGMHEWTIDEDQSRPFFRQALEAGINFFDTANGYSAGTSELITGRALREMARRDEIVVATKAFIPWRRAPNTGGLSRKALFQAIDDSLMRLGMDYVDLFQIHRFDSATPVEEFMEALHDIVKAGKARYIGASTMYAWQFMKAQATAERHGWTKFVSMQPQVNLIYREEEREMIPLCLDQGVGVIPWSPMARGKLTRDWDDKTLRSETDTFSKSIFTRFEEQDRLISLAVAYIARKRGVSRAQIALAWVLQKPGITAPIVGASKDHHLTDAVAALSLKLDDGEIAQLEEHYVPHVPVGFYDNTAAGLRLSKVRDVGTA